MYIIIVRNFQAVMTIHTLLNVQVYTYVHVASHMTVHVHVASHMTVHVASHMTVHVYLFRRSKGPVTRKLNRSVPLQYSNTTY